MSNLSQPSVHMTQTRGVISAGQFTLKNRIYNENLVHIAAPSWKAGCGGIDLFAGSFSFISGDQIVQLMRGVASNAAGYAFQVALDNVCPDCSKWINAFQNAVQKMNDLMANSCQLAQGLVNDTAEAMGFKAGNDMRLTTIAKGFKDDIFQSFSEIGGIGASTETTASSKKGSPEYDKYVGNIVWKQLKYHNVSNWFGASSDWQLLETLMSITGTVITHESSPDENGSDKNDFTIIQGNKVTMRDFVEGGSVKIYNCQDTEYCMLTSGVPEKEIKLDGLAVKIRDILLGKFPGEGAIYKFANNEGELNTNEKNLTTSLPAAMGTLIVRLSKVSEDAARELVRTHANPIALSMVYGALDQSLRAVNTAVTASKSPHKDEAFKIIKESSAKIESEYYALTNEYGRIADVLNHYESLARNIEKINLFLEKNFSDK